MYTYETLLQDLADCYAEHASPFIKRDIELLIQRAKRTSSVRHLRSEFESLNDTSDLRTGLADLLCKVWRLRRPRNINLALPAAELIALREA